MSLPTDIDTSLPAPPDGLTRPEAALWWLRKGSLRLGAEWNEAHEICQSAEGDPAHDWIHALCHLIEGDTGNAAYWFRRAEKPVERDAEGLWREIAEAL